jgi:CO/xanthine dehydrogenase Mo-binding subunit
LIGAAIRESTGIRFKEQPVTAEKIWKALEEKEKRKSRGSE